MRTAAVVGIAVIGLTVWIPAIGTAADAPSARLPNNLFALRNRFGATAAKQRLTSADPNERLRAVERLASLGTAPAFDALAEALDPTVAMARDLRVQLVAVRGLAAFVDQEVPRQLIGNALKEGIVAAAAGVELGALLRDTAALALARGGDEAAVDVLGRLVRQGTQRGEGAQAAQRALVAYPPARFSWLVPGQTSFNVALLELLGELGQAQAIPPLRLAVQQGEPTVRAAALVALAQCGDQAAAGVARQWATVPDPIARVAAAKVLLRQAAAEGRRLVAALLAIEETRAEALDLAATSPGPELGMALRPMTEGTDPDVRERVIALLGRGGGEGAAATLAGLVTRPATRVEAAMALGNLPGKEARDVLRQALRFDQTRALALRASVWRLLQHREVPDNLDDATAQAWRGDGAQRAAAAFADVARGRRNVDDRQVQAETTTAAAGVRGALATTENDVKERLRRLLVRTAQDPIRHVANGAALVFFPTAPGLPTARLRLWIEQGGAEAPLAARALAARDDDDDRVLISALLAAGDPGLRAHIADGLGFSPQPDALGRLAQAYRFETDGVVRGVMMRALVRTLSRPPDTTRRRVLEAAAALDPEASIRAVARGALRGDFSSDFENKRSLKNGLGWVFVPPRSEKERSTKEVTGAVLRWERSDGLTLPVMTDPDGLAVVPALPVGTSHVTLAPGVSPEQRTGP